MIPEYAPFLLSGHFDCQVQFPGLAASINPGENLWGRLGHDTKGPWSKVGRNTQLQRPENQLQRPENVNSTVRAG